MLDTPLPHHSQPAPILLDILDIQRHEPCPPERQVKQEAQVRNVP